jgi:hypothetical protein
MKTGTYFSLLGFCRRRSSFRAAGLPAFWVSDEGGIVTGGD